MSERGQDLQLVAALLAAQSTLSLATTNENGQAYVTPLFYYFVEPEFALCWLSSADSQHSRNLARNSAAAVTVYRQTEKWQEICGVQMTGQAVRIEDRARRKTIVAGYMKRFHLGTIFRLAISRSVLYAFRPAWIRYLDNSKRFGYKTELTLPPEGNDAPH